MGGMHRTCISSISRAYPGAVSAQRTEFTRATMPKSSSSQAPLHAARQA